MTELQTDALAPVSPGRRPPASPLWLVGSAGLSAALAVVVDRDGRYAYVTNTYANSVSVLDVKDRKVTKTVPVGKAPNGISVTP